MITRRRLLKNIAFELNRYRFAKANGDEVGAALALSWARHWRDWIRKTTLEGL